MKIKRVSDATARKFKLRVLHISDTHGHFPQLYGRFDVVVHSGDFFPNSQYCGNNNQLEMAFQMDWLKQKAQTVKEWLRGHPFLFTMGNHDFLHADIVTMVLGQEAGLTNVRCLHDRVVDHQGVKFYGFPYVPTISGSWNYERDIPEMQQETDKMVSVLNQEKVDVLVCHCPPYQMLDLTIGNQLIGNTVMNNALDYQIEKEKMPTHYLCGHCHEAHGMAMRNGVLVSNAAITQHIVEI